MVDEESQAQGDNTMKTMTKLEACREWVNSFNAIPQSIIERVYKEDIDELDELTPVIVGDTIWCDDLQDEFEIKSIDYSTDNAVITDENNEEFEVNTCNIYVDHDSWLPMWGTMWTLSSIDEQWIKDNRAKVVQCGFRIFESDELGVFIGIDGAGYDFYEAH